MLFDPAPKAHSAGRPTRAMRCGEPLAHAGCRRPAHKFLLILHDGFVFIAPIRNGD